MDKNIKPEDKSVKPAILSKRKRPSNWKKLILSHPKSLLEVSQFCKKHNISKSSFYKWSRELSAQSKKDEGKFITIKEVSPQEKSVSKFIAKKPKPVLPTVDSISSPIKVTLPNEVNLEFIQGCNLSELSKLISLLNAA